MMKLLTFGWMKGWRTYAAIGVVVAGYVIENFGGVDIPGFTFDGQSVLLALGLGSAANHKTA